MIKKILKKIGKNSIISQKEIASAAHENRNAVLKLSSEIISKNTSKIIEANKEDFSLAGLVAKSNEKLLLKQDRLLKYDFLSQTFRLYHFFYRLIFYVKELDRKG